MRTSTGKTDGLARRACAPTTLVLRQVCGGGDLYDLSLWVNPVAATEAELPTPDAAVTGCKPDYANGNTAKIQWRAAKTQVDSFILADAYEDLPLHVAPGGNATVIFVR
jgi:hypothetical protein